MLQQSAVHIRYVTPHHKTITPLYDSKPCVTNTAHLTTKLYIYMAIHNHAKLLICRTLHDLTIPSITPHYKYVTVDYSTEPLLHETLPYIDWTALIYRSHSLYTTKPDFTITQLDDTPLHAILRYRYKTNLHSTEHIRHITRRHIYYALHDDTQLHQHFT